MCLSVGKTYRKYITFTLTLKLKKYIIICYVYVFQDDPSAHDVFIKINRAYEVLKDEELRKKYDQYGEEGLNEDHQRGRRYESWQWYQQNFGKKGGYNLYI